MTNLYLKRIMKQYGVKQWQIAEYLGINEFSFSRRMRKQLSSDEINQYIRIIKYIAKKNLEAILNDRR